MCKAIHVALLVPHDPPPSLITGNSDRGNSDRCAKYSMKEGVDGCVAG